MADFDVLIAGAGPAGCATVLSLASFAPELRVALVVAVGNGKALIGETVPPQINPILAHLGVFQNFSHGGHSLSFRTAAAWGDARLGVNEFLFDAHQVGWRLDRTAFDRMLIEAASARVGAVLPSKVTALVKENGGWRVSLADGTMHTAYFAVDATGRGAALARQCRLRPINVDRLVGCCLRTRSRSDGNEGLMVESFADGWWYSAALPGGDRILACMTDADRVRALGLSSGRGFAGLLAETKHVRRVAELDNEIDRPTIWPASSRFIDSTADLPLLCVGDAALCFDPISGQGILAALRSGIFASYAIGDWLRSGDSRGLTRYRSMQQRSFSDYCKVRREYYAQEQRWPDNPFWRRRNGHSSSALTPRSGLAR